MRPPIALLLTLALSACATCKSSDTYEQCRTKERDRSQRLVSIDAVPAAAGMERRR